MVQQENNYKKYQKLVDGKNINPQTLLATDYLNHFNEIHMLLGMITDMPDCLEDILEWKKISYSKHFEYSNFQDKDIAIESYKFSPSKYKLPFEKCVAKMDDLLTTTISKAELAIKSENFDKLNLIVSRYSPKMEKLIEKCSAIINGIDLTAQQAVIDDYFKDGSNDSIGAFNQGTKDNLFQGEILDSDTDAIDQSSIDDLFG